MLHLCIQFSPFVMTQMWSDKELWNVTQEFHVTYHQSHCSSLDIGRKITMAWLEIISSRKLITRASLQHTHCSPMMNDFNWEWFLHPCKQKVWPSEVQADYLGWNSWNRCNPPSSIKLSASTKNTASTFIKQFNPAIHELQKLFRLIHRGCDTYCSLSWHRVIDLS